MSSKASLNAIYRLEFCKKRQDWIIASNSKSEDVQNMDKTGGSYHQIDKDVSSRTSQRIDLNRTYELDTGVCIDTNPSSLSISLGSGLDKVVNSSRLRTASDSVWSLESEATFMLAASQAPHSSEKNLLQVVSNSDMDQRTHSYTPLINTDWEKEELQMISKMSYVDIMRAAAKEQEAMQRHARRNTQLLQLCHQSAPFSPSLPCLSPDLPIPTNYPLNQADTVREYLVEYPDNNYNNNPYKKPNYCHNVTYDSDAQFDGSVKAFQYVQNVSPNNNNRTLIQISDKQCVCSQMPQQNVKFDQTQYNQNMQFDQKLKYDQNVQYYQNMQFDHNVQFDRKVQYNQNAKLAEEYYDICDQTTPSSEKTFIYVHKTEYIEQYGSINVNTRPTMYNGRDDNIPIQDYNPANFISNPPPTMNFPNVVRGLGRGRLPHNNQFMDTVAAKFQRNHRRN